jgi:hypothetical protein
MSRSLKSRSQRRSKPRAEANHRESRSPDAMKMRRYLAFVRAVVGAGAKGSGR